MNNTKIFRAALFFAALLSAINGRTVTAAIESRNILKSYFESGDKPTGEQFATLIDSAVNLSSDGVSIVGIGIDSSHGDFRAAKLSANLIGLNLAYANLPPIEPNWAGDSGYLPLELRDAAGETHFGFFQMSMDAVSSPPLASGPAIHVDYLAWESDPNTPILASPVPEPTALGGVIFTAVLLRRRR